MMENWERGQQHLKIMKKKGQLNCIISFVCWRKIRGNQIIMREKFGQRTLKQPLTTINISIIFVTNGEYTRSRWYASFYNCLSYTLSVRQSVFFRSQQQQYQKYKRKSEITGNLEKKTPISLYSKTISVMISTRTKVKKRHKKNNKNS